MSHLGVGRTGSTLSGLGPFELQGLVSFVLGLLGENRALLPPPPPGLCYFLPPRGSLLRRTPATCGYTIPEVFSSCLPPRRVRGLPGSGGVARKRACAPPHDAEAEAAWFRVCG